MSRRMAILLIVFVGSVALVSGGLLVKAQVHNAPVVRHQPAELDVFSRLNRWRIERGYPPLAHNDDLQALALQQARYVWPLMPNDDPNFDIHADRWGDGVSVRARGVDWPDYGDPDMMVIGEITAWYRSIEAQFNFWQNSPPHTAAATSRDFREMGVATLYDGTFYLSVVVLGARPEVYPVVIDDERNRMYIHRDESFFNQDFFPQFMRFEDAYGNPMHADDWLLYDESMRLMPDLPWEFTVVLSDGFEEVRTVVQPDEARAFPARPTPTPSPTPTITPSPTVIFAKVDPPTPTPTPSPTPTLSSQGADVRLTFAEDGFTLTNISGRRLNLAPYILEHSRLEFSERLTWFGAYSPVPMALFPPGACVTAWSYPQQGNVGPSMPPECQHFASGRSRLDLDERFWLIGEVIIRRANEVIVRCPVAWGVCEFNLPG